VGQTGPSDTSYARLVGLFGKNFPSSSRHGGEMSSMRCARIRSTVQSMMAIATVSERCWRRATTKVWNVCLGTGVFGTVVRLPVFSRILWSLRLAVIGAAPSLHDPTNSMIQLSTEPTMRGRIVAMGMGVMLGGTAMGLLVGWGRIHVGPAGLSASSVSAFSQPCLSLMMAKPVAAPLDT